MEVDKQFQSSLQVLPLLKKNKKKNTAVPERFQASFNTVCSLLELSCLTILYGLLQDRNSFTLKLEDTENWLYEDGEDQPKQVYIDKLTELKVCGKEFGNVDVSLQSCSIVVILNAFLIPVFLCFRLWVSLFKQDFKNQRKDQKRLRT